MTRDLAHDNLRMVNSEIPKKNQKKKKQRGS